MFRLSAKHIATYLLLGLGFAVVMGFMYMQYVYYDAMVAAMNVSNTELGMLITILGATAFVTAVPCGALADRIDCRKATSYSLFLMMIMCAVFAVFPTYPIAIATWLIDGIVMSVWYCAIYKTVRILAPPEAIGKSFGMFGIGVACGSIVVNVAGLALYDSIAASSGLVAGFSAAVWTFFVAGMVSAVFGHIAIMRIPAVGEVKEATVDGKKKPFSESLREVGQALKSASVWLYLLGCFCIYSFQVSISYFTPYFTAVLGTTVAFSGFVAVFRQYGLRIISSPIGGILGDKIGGTAKVIRVSMAILAVFVLVVLFLPADTPMWVLVVIVFGIGLLGTMNISLQASISEDAMVPPAQMGLAVGLTSMLTADLFQPTLFGWWLDMFGNQGYTYIWIYTLCILALGITVLSIMVARKKRIKTAQASKNDSATEVAEASVDARA